MPRTVPYVARKLGWKTCPGGYKKSGRGRAAYRHVPLPVVRGLLRQQEVVLGAWRAARASAPDMTEDEARVALERLDPLWEELFPAEQARIIHLLVDRVDIGPAGAAAGSHGKIRLMPRGRGAEIKAWRGRETRGAYMFWRVMNAIATLSLKLDLLTDVTKASPVWAFKMLKP